MRDYSIFSTEEVLLLSDTDYFYFVLDKIKNAKSKVFAVVFIIDPRVRSDKRRGVRLFLDELGYAKWQGVDVKVIVGRSDRVLNIDIANRVAFQYLQEKGIPTRVFLPTPKDYSLHSKYIVFDEDLVILGSHNWTDNAFHRSKEMSAAIYSKEVAIKMTKEFEELWSTGLEEIE